MARKLFAVGLLALCLVAGAAGQAGKEEVQAFVNEESNAVDRVKEAAGAAAGPLLEEIKQSIQNIAQAWWEIEWASQQSQWDSLVQRANIAVLQIMQILPQVPENSGQTWGSIYPREDLLGVAESVCETITELKPVAEEKFGVLLTITNMSACKQIGFDPEAAAAAPTPAPAPAPAPAGARKLLSA